MLILYRGNRIEQLAALLAVQLQLDPPPPLVTESVVVNTWPTSRWLGEQLAIRLGGIAANIRYPFPGSHLRQLVDGLLAADADPAHAAPGPLPAPDLDPWRAGRLVWPLLAELPAIRDGEAGEPLRRWQGQASGDGPLARAGWQLARAIADAFDDYGLYRPELLHAWLGGHDHGPDGRPLPEAQRWQPALLRALHRRLGVDPFGLRVERVIARLRRGPLPPGCLPPRLRLFALSSLAPVQVRLLQALSGHLPVELYLLTPCPDLWQRAQERRARLSAARALRDPLEAEWLLAAPGLEARFGRLGGEFLQLLEGGGEAQLGASSDDGLFLLPATAARQRRPLTAPPLLAQLQEQLVVGDGALQLGAGDRSLQFLPCAGAMRQLEVVRDQLLQLLAADASLQPRDILVMTPQIDRFAPLLPAVFGDSAATGVDLPWRLTDRSQHSQAGLGRSLLTLLQRSGERLSASALEAILDSPPLQARFGLTATATADLQQLLQRGGFRWGLDGRDRGGDASHSLAWAIDRLLLGLVLPEARGLAPAATAPLASGADLDRSGRWLHLLGRLRHWLARLGRARTAGAWASLLPQLMADLYGDGGEAAWELPGLLAAIDDWHRDAIATPELELEAAVLAAALEERLAVDSGRFGHRSGALTISALEPMRAIPHRVIVLLGLDADQFPRQGQRPAFHLMERQRLLGDPSPADQDRYVLLEALLSAREHLLISWSNRAEHSGEPLQPAAPVRQWLDWLAARLGPAAAGLTRHTPASPLARANFLPSAGPFPAPPPSCDRRLLQARQRLDQGAEPPAAGLVTTTMPAPGSLPADPAASEGEQLLAWLQAPQRQWLARLGLRPREWQAPLDDLEALSGDERLRAMLLRQVLADDPAAGDAGRERPEPWLADGDGRGLLPPAAAGSLEARLLAARWRSLRSSLVALGTPRQQPLAWGPWQAAAWLRGESVVLVHPGRAAVEQHLALWWLVLLAAAGGTSAAGGVLIARDGDAFTPQLQLAAPSAAAARAELERLAALEQHWRHRCWPLPPRTGWAWLAAEAARPGTGDGKAQACWEGGFGGDGERAREEMVVCFGAERPYGDLLALGLAERAAELYGPLLEAGR